MIQEHSEGLTSVYGVEADEAHASFFLQVLELTLPVAAHSAVNLPRRRERAVRCTAAINPQKRIIKDDLQQVATKQTST